MFRPPFSHEFRDELKTLFRWRRDVRHFRRDPVPPSAFDALLDLAALAPSVGLSQPWRFVTVEDAARRARVRASFEACNAESLAGRSGERAELHARLKLAGLDEAPCQFAVFAEPEPAQGHGLGRRTMPETTSYSAVMALHTLWLAAQAEGLGLGWVSILDPRPRHCGARRSAGLDPDRLFLPRLSRSRQRRGPELERAGWEYRRPGASTVIRR